LSLLLIPQKENEENQIKWREKHCQHEPTTSV
jgi:hypothetical protein